jgi:hypothetical protein
VAFWIVYFGVGVFVLYGLARAWGRASGNGYMTVGLRRTISTGASGADPTSHTDATPVSPASALITRYVTGDPVKDYRRHGRSVVAALPPRSGEWARRPGTRITG